MTHSENSRTMNSTSKIPPASNYRPPTGTGSAKNSPNWSPPGPPTTAGATRPLIKAGSKSSHPTSAKPELDLLVAALQRLDQDYQLRNQQLDRHLNALAGQLESLAKRVSNLTVQVSNLAAQLARCKDS